MTGWWLTGLVRSGSKGEGLGSVLSSASSVEFNDQPLQASLLVEVEVLSSELTKRQTTAQSSTLEVGYLILQDRTAASTTKRAACD